MLISTSFFSVLVGTITTYLSAINLKGAELEAQQVTIENLCKHFELNQELKTKITKALQYRTNNNFFSIFAKGGTLDDVPMFLRKRVKSFHK